MDKSDFISHVPDLKDGLSRVLDLGSTINKKILKIRKDENIVDREAILSDWTVVGDDIRRATNEFRSLRTTRK